LGAALQIAVSDRMALLVRALGAFAVDAGSDLSRRKRLGAAVRVSSTTWSDDREVNSSLSPRRYAE
jgi:hypothetical protein